MKPTSTLRLFLALAGSSLLALSSASGDTYTWTQTGDGSQDWTTAGNWDANGVFASDQGNELRFFADTSTITLTAGASQVVIDVPTSLSLNTLTLNGRGPNDNAGSSITIGTSASTWTIGDGTTSTINLNSLLGGGGANRDLRYTIGANLTLVGNASGITTFTGGSTSGYGAIFSGNITGAGKGITKSGSSLLVFSGNNSYTGTTLITGGVLRLASANALSGGIGTTGGTSALTLNGGILELGAGDFSRGLGTGSSQFQITGGTSGFSAYDGPRIVTVGGNASSELQWGSTHFQPGTLVLNQAFGFNAQVPPYPNGSIELANKIDLNGATRTVQVGANIALISGDIRTSSGTAGLTKTGNGTLVLTGNNTYNGATTISGGTLSVGTDSNFNSGSSGIIVNAGSLQITGTTLTSLSGLGPAVTFNSGNKGFDIQDAANIFTVDQVLNQGSGTLTKSGVGTLVLNQNNTFTGATSATGGGTLVLDYTTNNGSKLSDTQALTLNGSALVLKGGSHNEIVSATSLTAFSSNSLSRDGGTSTIDLKALTLNNGSSLAISESNLATTTSSNVNGILSHGRVTVGDHFGTNDSGSIVAYSGYTAATTAGGGNSSVVHELTGGGTMAANLASYSLRIVNDANSNVLDLNTRNINLTNNTTLLYAGGFDNQYTINSTTGAVTSNSGNQPFVINTYVGTTLTVNGRTSANFAAVSKAGEGTLVFGGNNSTMGIAYVQQGVLRVTNSDGLGDTTRGTTVQGGAALELANNISIGAETLDLNGAGVSGAGALRNLSGDNSWAGAITIGNSGARINADASSSLTLTGGIVTTLTQDVTFGGAGDTTVSTAVISGSGSLIKDGSGTLTLGDANTYTGATTVSQGTLLVNNTSGSGTGTGPVTIASGATLGGTGTLGGATTISGAHAPGNNGLGSQNFGSSLNYGTGSIFQWDLTQSSTSTGFDTVAATGSISVGTGAIFHVILGGTALTEIQDLNNAFWNTPFITQDWAMSDIFGKAFASGAFSSVTTSTNVSAFGSFSISGSTLTWTAIPEPSTALAGLLLGLGLLRRRRH